ncbi:MAG TPA: hypothetical protein ENG87_04070 [Candidatus Pacearchaeota archaeon]|nr:hypothetical protein BMS3Abin17_00785 [archaeon BMS3Abin17]HDK42531.1 hypothetical protein [Candidatus Pacearchaeota archaeon]HDZ60554.1 hypothetical protein [Candidatus Pacearchaeota archaeon]
MKQKKIIIGAGIFLACLFSIMIVSAEFLVCFDYGEVRNYCSNYKPAETCDNSNGCQWCASVYREPDDCYIHGSWPKCNQLPQECSVFGSNTTFDITPPQFTLNTPTEGSIYTSRSVLVDFSLDETADVYYTDLIDGRGRWTRICNDCSPGDPAYSKKRSFDEGLNQIQFKAIDVVGNEVLSDVSFFVDSKKPKIYKTLPRKGFADGNFEVQFKEANHDTLTMYYGNTQTGIRNYNVNIDSECYEKKGKHYCENIFADLDDYDGQEIEFWFNLTDMADNSDDSKHYNLDVDTTFPVLNNPSSFWTQGEGKYAKYIYFNLNITELNFDEAVYTYFDSRGKLRERRLCSRLKDGICEKRKSFRRGNHSINVQIIDEAGNSIAMPLEFEVNY